MVDCAILIYVLDYRLKERRVSSGDGTKSRYKEINLITERTYKTCLVTVGIKWCGVLMMRLL